MADAFDFKKEFPDLYKPKKTPAIIRVPEMCFFAVEGEGNPNEPDGAFGAAVGLLYALSFSVKMSKMGAYLPAGYFDYVVPPLEGLWRMQGGRPGVDYAHKENFRWTVMIRQPDFVTEEVFFWAREQVITKKKLDPSPARRIVFTEGLCVQCLHQGSYDDEPATVEMIERFIAENGLKNDITDQRHHHEIYLSDPRRGDPAKSRTILRIPVR